MGVVEALLGMEGSKREFARISQETNSSRLVGVCLDCQMVTGNQ